MAKIISVHSFRGGTGKSNLTANLAVATAMDGKRVAIVDTDIQSPGVHVLFGLNEEVMTRSLNDYLWGQCTISDAAYDVTPPGAAAVNGKVYLIPSSIKAGEIARVLNEGYSVTALNDGFRKLCQDLGIEYLLIDTHPGLNRETLLSIAISDALLIMLRPDQQDFQGTAVTLQVARKLDIPKTFLVVNKVLPIYDSATLQKQLEEKFQVPVVSIFPLSEGMIQLGSSGLFVVECPDDPYSVCTRDVAAHVIS